MRTAATQGMSLWIAPLILHSVIALAIADLTDTAFWLVILAMMVARGYFSGVRLLGRTIAWYAYEKERIIRDIVEEFDTAKLPVARQAESYDAYFNRIADSSDMPVHVKRYAIRKLDYIWFLDAVSLVDRWREETVLKAAMSRYAARKGQD